MQKMHRILSNHHDPKINKNVPFLSEIKMFNIDKSFIKNTFKIKLAKLSAVCRDYHVQDKSGRLF